MLLKVIFCDLFYFVIAVTQNAFIKINNKLDKHVQFSSTELKENKKKRSIINVWDCERRIPSTTLQTDNSNAAVGRNLFQCRVLVSRAAASAPPLPTSALLFAYWRQLYCSDSHASQPFWDNLPQNATLRISSFLSVDTSAFIDLDSDLFVLTCEDGKNETEKELTVHWLFLNCCSPSRCGIESS